MEKNKTDKKEIKGPVSQEKIFKIMLIVTFAVAGIFFLKNVITKSVQGVIVIGVCLFVFWLIQFLMKKLHVSQLRQQLVMCICLVLLTFIISLSTGDFYSDDFPLFLAVLAVSGLYLEPLYTNIQTVLITIMLIALYIINPDKADPLSQYIMCVVCFDVAAFIINLVIKRGRAFIQISMMRAEEAEQLLNSMYKVSEELKASYDNSASRIDGMRTVNEQLEENTKELRRGSLDITQGTKEVEIACEDVQERMQVTENQIGDLNREVKNVEESLEQIQEISKVAEHLTTIDSSTKMLALNASIEAARAGESGKGFDGLMNKFSSLYENIEKQNENVSDVDKIFDSLKEKVLEMSASSEENQSVVESIVDAMGSYKNHMNLVVEDAKQLQELSAAMVK